LLTFNLKEIVLKNFVWPFALLCMLFTGPGCVKKAPDCTPKTTASEAPQIQAYAAANNMNVIAHSSGLYYQVIDPGSGAMATINSSIVITYTGMLLNGTIFDQRITPNNTQTTGSESPWLLNKLIEGWRVGIPLIRKGGRIQLIVPSSMGYGCAAYGAIPADSILFFDITLVDVL
jgi:FKBP-type peptidyl-prolyl cis-trans isomerase FkpA